MSDTPRTPRSGLDPHPSLTQLREQYRARTGRALVLEGEAPARQDVTTSATPRYPAKAVAVAPVVAWPLRLILPWSALVSDNDRYTVDRGRLHLTKQYRAGRKLVRQRAATAMGGAQPVALPLRLEARVWVPDHRTHDCCNFAKGVQDALQKHVYTHDGWLHDTRWTRAGVDCDAPRAEITITPLPAAA